MSPEALESVQTLLGGPGDCSAWGRSGGQTHSVSLTGHADTWPFGDRRKGRSVSLKPVSLMSRDLTLALNRSYPPDAQCGPRASVTTQTQGVSVFIRLPWLTAAVAEGPHCTGEPRQLQAVAEGGSHRPAPVVCLWP